MAFGRLVFDRLCVGRLYCVVSCVHYEKLLLFVIIFCVRSFIRSPQRLADVEVVFDINNLFSLNRHRHHCP